MVINKLLIELNEWGVLDSTQHDSKCEDLTTSIQFIGENMYLNGGGLAATAHMYRLNCEEVPHLNAVRPVALSD